MDPTGVKHGGCGRRRWRRGWRDGREASKCRSPGERGQTLQRRGVRRGTPDLDQRDFRGGKEKV